MSLQQGLAMVAVGMLAFAGPCPAAEKPRVVVLDFKSSGLEASEAKLSAWSDRFEDILGKTGYFEVLPRRLLKREIRRRQASNDGGCNRRCQLQIAVELGATEAVEAQIVAVPSGCEVKVSQVDLARHSKVGASNVLGKCNDKGVIISLDWAVVELTYQLSRRDR